jgi:hypothetical protein
VVAHYWLYHTVITGIHQLSVLIVAYVPIYVAISGFHQDVHVVCYNASSPTRSTNQLLCMFTVAWWCVWWCVVVATNADTILLCGDRRYHLCDMGYPLHEEDMY